MEFKHILFSSLVLSTTFVACTNEEFLIEDVQNSTKDAVSLGEGFTISGNFAGPASRAIYEETVDGTKVSIKSKWEPTDSVGGAWYAAWTSGTGNSAQGFFFGTPNRFASNHPFTRVNKEGTVESADFATNTNVFAGKYVLYFPFDSSVKATAESIPVKMSTAQTMDVAAPMQHVNDAMFFYTNTEYTTGGAQKENFEMSPIPVIYRLTFKAAEGARGIVGKNIQTVIVETNNKLYSEGKVSVTGSTYVQGKANYSGVTGTSVYTLTLKGNEGNADYQISAVGTDGGMKKPFYLSVLPANEEITELTLKVVADDGKVYSATIDGLDTDDLKNVKSELTSEGGLFAANVTLTAQAEAGDKIYNESQFVAAFEEAVKSGNSETIELGADLVLDELSLNTQGANITINGAKLTVKTLDVQDGNLTVDNLVAENATVGMYGTLSTTATNVSGKLEVGGNATLGGVESLNSVLVRRKGTISVTGESNSQVKGAFTSEVESDVTLNNIILAGTNSLNGEITTTTGKVTFKGATTFAKDAVVTLSEDTDFTGNLTNNGAITLNTSKTANFTNLTNAGTITIGNSTGGTANFNGTTTNKGELAVGLSATAVNIGSGNNAASAVFNNEGVITIATGKTITNNGTMNMKAVVEGCDYTGTITNNGTLNVNAADVPAEGIEVAIPANLNVTNNAGKTVNVNLPSSTSEVTFTELLNSGIVNINKGNVKAKVTGTTGDIIVAEAGKLTWSTSSNYSSYVIIKKDADTAIDDTNTISSAKVACYWSDLATAAADIVIFNTKTSLTEANIQTLNSKNIVLRADLELQADLTMSASKTLTVEAEVLLTGKDSDKTLTLASSTTNTVATGCLLKVGTNAILNKNGNTFTDGVVSVGGTIN